MKSKLTLTKSIKLLLIVLFTAALMVNSQRSSAQVLMTEDFNYTGGSLITANGWTAVSAGGTNAITVTSAGNGLAYAGSPRSWVGHSVSMTTSGEDDTYPYTAVTSGSVYASFLINVSAAQSAGDYFFLLGASPSTYQLRFFAKSSGAGYVFGISKSSGTTAYDGTIRTFGTTYFVTVKYAYQPSSQDDIVSFWINPILGSTEGTPTVTTTGAVADATTINMVGLRQGTAGSAATQVVDGIMVGTTWASVTPYLNTATLANIATQPSGIVFQGNTSVLAGFTVNSDSSANLTGVTVSASGTSVSGDFNGNIKIYRDNNGDGLIDGTDADVSGGGVPYSSSMAFTVTGETGIFAARNYLIVATIAGAGTSTAGHTVTASIASGAFTSTGTSNTGSATGNSLTITAPIPVITLNGTSTTNIVLNSGFNYVHGNPTPPANSFTVSAVNLADNVTVTPVTTDYQVSTTSATAGFGASATLTYNSGTGTLTTNPQTVWVRLAPGIASSLTAYKNETVNVTTTGTGANAPTVTASGVVYSGQFTTGDVAVEILSATSASTGNPISINEYNPTGSLVNVYNFPSSGNPSLTDISASVTGYFNLSSDGSFLTVPGYNGATGTTEPTSTFNAGNSTTGDVLARAIGTVRPGGSVSVSPLALNYDMPYAFRSVVSDGVSFWGGGTAATGGYSLVYMHDSTASTIVNLSTTTLRGVGIGAGNLYYVAAGTNDAVGIFQVGTNGLPVTTPVGNPVNIIADGVYNLSSNSGNPETFVMNPQGTILYLADNNAWTARNPASETGGVLRFNNVGGTWTFAYALSPNANDFPVEGVTADWSGPNPVVYAITTSNTLCKIIDDGVNTVGTPIDTAASGTAFRGVSMSPVAATSPTLLCSATHLVFPGTVVGQTSPEQLFSVSGYGLGNHNVTVTAPTGYYISTTSGAEGTNTTVTITPNASGVANQIVYIVFAPSSTGSYNSTPLKITDAAGGATELDVPISGSAVTSITYYNKANTDVTIPTNWGTNTDGSGSSPLNFTGDGQIFNLVNTGYSLSQNWVITGTLSKIVVGNGVAAYNFIVPAAHSYTGTADVAANGTLTISNAAIPTLGTLDPASTVVYNYDGAAIIPNAIYGNLSIVGVSSPTTDIFTFNKTTGSALTINGNFSVSKAAVMGSIQSPFTTMFLAGNFTASSGATFGYAPPATVPAQTQPLISITTSGNGNQTFSYSGGTILISSLVSTKSAGTFTLGNNTTLIVGNGGTLTYSGTASFVSNAGSSFNGTGTVGITLTFSGSSSFSLGGNINASDNTSALYTTTPGTPSVTLQCNFSGSANFYDNGHTVEVSEDLGMTGSASNYHLTGTVLMATRSGYSEIKGNSTSTTIAGVLNNLTIETFSGATYIDIEPSSGGQLIQLNGNFAILNNNAGSASVSLYGNTLGIAGSYSDNFTTNVISTSPTNSVFLFNGTGGAQTFTSANASGESMNNVTINNPAGVNFTGASGMDIITPGALTLIAGILHTSTGKVTLGVASTISESVSSYVIGTVTSTRTLSSNTNETFGGMGIEVDALGSAPGSTIATRVTGVSSPIGCASNSILRKFTLTPTTNTGLNATVVLYYLASSFELNGFSGSNLSLFESTNGGSSWNSLVSTDNSGASTVTTSGMSALGLIAASTPVPVGGMVTPINSIVCPSSSATLTANGATGTLQWQSSTDNVNWSDIAGETNATYSASPSVKTYYRATATFPGCLVVSSTTGVVEVSSPTITVTSTSITGNSVTLNWSPVGTGNYSINFSGASSGTLTSVTPPKTVGGLTAGGTYDFTITQTGASLTGCPASGSLTNVTTQCAAPANVAATSPSANQLQVSWTGTPGTNYRVFYRPLFSYNTYFTKDVINNSSVVITRQGNNNIYASNTYEVYVTTLDCPTTGAVGAPSNFVYVTTLPTVACATPVIDSVRSICPVQIEVFIHPNPDITNYTVYLQRETPTVLAVNSYGIASNYFTINTPYSGDQYLIAVEAKCSSNSVSAIAIWPGNVTIKPLCDGPANLILSNPTCHGFTASWNADECVSNSASGYDLYLRVAGTINYNSYGVGLPANGLSPSDVINWLSTGRTYQVFVRSIYNCNGFVTYGPVSQTLSINTLSSGCRDEEDAPATEQAPAVQQTAPDNSEVMTLYPNPNNGQFEVALSSLNTDDREVRVEVMNMLGQTVVTHFSTIGGGQYNEQIKLPSAAAGTYIVRVTVGKNTYTSKINVSK